MNRRISISFLFAVSVLGCGGRQSAPVQIETRPLEEGKAISIIEESLAERGYAWDKDSSVQAAGTGEFAADFQVKGEKLVIEYLTAEDRARIGQIPPAAEGSRLHVVNGRAVDRDTGVPFRVFVFFIDDRKFLYHANPTSKVRADVTFLEVDSRLRRDISDFISWYENSKKR
jgi:hypothetical protein